MEIQTEKPNLTNLASEVKTLEGDQKFMEPGTTKKKRGRPSKEERAQKVKAQSESAKQTQQQSSQSQSDTSTQVPPIPSKEIAKPVCQLISKIGAGIVEDPRAQMTPEELENVATAMGMVMDKWMPFVSTQYGAELYLCLALGSWGTRLYAFQKLKKAKAKEEKEKEEIQKAHEQVVPMENPMGVIHPTGMIHTNAN